jgi:hypothetical protein
MILSLYSVELLTMLVTLFWWRWEREWHLGVSLVLLYPSSDGKRSIYNCHVTKWNFVSEVQRKCRARQPEQPEKVKKVKFGFHAFCPRRHLSSVDQLFIAILFSFVCLWWKWFRFQVNILLVYVNEYVYLYYNVRQERCDMLPCYATS